MYICYWVLALELVKRSDMLSIIGVVILQIFFMLVKHASLLLINALRLQLTHDYQTKTVHSTRAHKKLQNMLQVHSDMVDTYLYNF